MLSLNHILAIVLILTIVFVEDVNILYHPTMVVFIGTLFVASVLFYCQENIGLGMLLSVLFVLVYVQFCNEYYGVKQREYFR